MCLLGLFNEVCQICTPVINHEFLACYEMLYFDCIYYDCPPKDLSDYQLLSIHHWQTTMIVV